MCPPVVESSIIVTSASGVLADQVAEHTVALLTGLLRSLPVYFRAQQKKEYVRRPTRDLHGRTIGIVGLGGVGRRVAEVLAPFKTRILATDMYPVDKPPHVESLWPADRLDDLLPLVDVLILSVPLTDQTRWMIDARRLAMLQPGTLLMNVARGQLVVEKDLVAALESGHLSGAGLDVAAQEPLPPSSRLWELPNVIITPHVGGQSARRIDDMTDFFCENLRRYQSSEPLLNLVDKRLGYPVRKAAARSRICENSPCGGIGILQNSATGSRGSGSSRVSNSVGDAEARNFHKCRYGRERLRRNARLRNTCNLSRGKNGRALPLR